MERIAAGYRTFAFTSVSPIDSLRQKISRHSVCTLRVVVLGLVARHLHATQLPVVTVGIAQSAWPAVSGIFRFTFVFGRSRRDAAAVLRAHLRTLLGVFHSHACPE